jgi:regulator of sirC expression with transglutaminase-like and TPR domain
MAESVNDNNSRSFIALSDMGRLEDAKIDPAIAALFFASLDHPGRGLGAYQSHLDQLTTTCLSHYNELLAKQAADDAYTRLAALRVTLFSDFGYTGDETDYHNIDNADLMRVIDRRKGMPVALAILYISVGQRLGWMVSGLNIPGHFICRIDCGSERIIFDPFYGGRVLEAQDLRQLIKISLGADAEISSSYVEPASKRDSVLRLQNNRKIRFIENEEYEDALRVVMAMRAFAPNEYRLLLDEGVLSARTDRRSHAVKVLEKYIEIAPDPQDRHDAALLLYEIKSELN